MLWWSMLAAALGATPVPALPRMTEATWVGLRAGEVEVAATADGSAIGADVLAWFDAPPERLWERILDFESQDDWVPDLTQARVVGREGEVAICAGVTPVPWPISDRTWAIRVHNRATTLDDQPVWLSTWTLQPDSGNMVANDGYWLLLPHEGGTLVRYVFRADAGLSVPDFLEQAVTRRSMPKMIAALRAALAR